MKRTNRAATPTSTAWQIGFGLGLLLVGGCNPTQEKLHPVVVLAVDGATWDVADPLLEAGDLPHLRNVMERGSRATLVTFPPLLSPVVWTTVATGRFPRHHNILDFTFPYVGGPRDHVLSTARKVPAIWNIASHYGRRVGVVGYLVTSPAEAVEGFIVPDHLVDGGSVGTYPADLGERLPSVDSRADRQAAFARFLPWGYEPRQSEDPRSPYQRATEIVRGRVDGSILRDETVRLATLELLDQPVDLLLVYVRIIDNTSHSGWLYYDDSDFPEPAPVRERQLLAGLIPEAYRWVDDLLGAILSRLGETTNVIVLSDHGFGSATGPYSISDRQLVDKLTGNHRHDALFASAGPDLSRSPVRALTHVDIAPLVLTLLGIPLSQELEGRLPEELLRPDLLHRRPTSTVRAYNLRGSSPPSPPVEASDLTDLGELAALGYLSRHESRLPVEGAESYDFWRIDRRLRDGALQGELLTLLMRGRQEDAVDLLLEAERSVAGLGENLLAQAEVAAGFVQDDLDFSVLSAGALDRLTIAFRAAVAESHR